MTARSTGFALFALVLALGGCDERSDFDGGTGGDAGRTPDGGPLPGDAGVDAGSDGGTADAGTTDGGPREVEVRCRESDGPTVTVTRDPGGDTSLLRLELSFEGGATGIVLDEVTQYDASEEMVRGWELESLAGPPGFAGSVEARLGRPNPTVVFTSVAPSIASETEVCEGPWYTRDGGRVDVRGRTAEGGVFEASCSLAWNPAGLDDSLRFACARGVPGWMPQAFDAVGDIETPVDSVLLSTTVEAYGNGASSLTGFVVSEADVRVHVETGFGTDCPTSTELWEVRGASNTLWRGSSSEEVWSGPLAPGALEEFHWFANLPGDAPSSVCTGPDPTVPIEEMCPQPSLQIVLRGTSSAGPWEWESDAFTCYLPPST